MKVKKVESLKVNSITVYDAEVEVEHAFVCNSVILHNSPYCRAADGKIYDKNFKGVGHDFPLRIPPAHWNCRSTLLPITKSWAELSGKNSKLSKKQLQKIEKNTTPVKRAAMGKPAPSDMDYNDWLLSLPKESSKKIQEEVLGIKKRELWKKNKLTMTDLLDQRGNPITVEKLEKIYK
jgi:hypothetical protein